MNAVKKTVAGAVILGGMLMAAWGTGWQNWNRPGALTRVESYSLEALAFRGREIKETTDPGIVRSDHTHQKDCGHATYLLVVLPGHAISENGLTAGTIVKVYFSGE